jgi:hypothetical protein
MIDMTMTMYLSCGCGSIICNTYMSRRQHTLTKKHQQFLTILEEQLATDNARQRAEEDARYDAWCEAWREAWRVTAAACTIQRAWKRAISNPEYSICRGRLLEEFAELTGSCQ